MPERNCIFTSYSQAVEYLYSRLPFFQHQGASAYKPDLGNITVLLEALGNPHEGLKYIHVGGTNGKGSSSHILAAILQSSGYKTGLFTSPHLKSFTERIKVNGSQISQDQVLQFVNEVYDTIEKIRPSFFEVTTAMAFDHFKMESVDVAVIEVGLGGRLDATNLITPLVSLITNIGHDHLDLLGPTLTNVAFEKAGIIKSGVPVVISERQPGLDQVFEKKAESLNSEIVFASDHFTISDDSVESGWEIQSEDGCLKIESELKGGYQKKNICGVMGVVKILRAEGFLISPDAVQSGISKISTLTGLKGRWQLLRTTPRVICDTGHNPEGIIEVIRQLNSEEYRTLRWVFGMVGDKPADYVLSLLPKNAVYYFCAANNPRAMDVNLLAGQAELSGLKGKVISGVNDALALALEESEPDDLILIGGSTYVVAEVEGI